jgi:hypothetical protein
MLDTATLNGVAQSRAVPAATGLVATDVLGRSCRHRSSGSAQGRTL